MGTVNPRDGTDLFDCRGLRTLLRAREISWYLRGRNFGRYRGRQARSRPCRCEGSGSARRVHPIGRREPRHRLDRASRPRHGSPSVRGQEGGHCASRQQVGASDLQGCRTGIRAPPEHLDADAPRVAQQQDGGAVPTKKLGKHRNCLTHPVTDVDRIAHGSLECSCILPHLYPCMVNGRTHDAVSASPFDFRSSSCQRSNVRSSSPSSSPRARRAPAMVAEGSR